MRPAPSGLTFVSAVCYIIALPGSPVESLMKRTVAPILPLLACALALAGCRGTSTTTVSNGGPVAVKTEDVGVPALNSFTEMLLGRVEKAADTKAGVAEAQALLEERRGGLTQLVGELKRNPRAKAQLLEAEVDNTDRVHRLQLKYADAAARDAELKAGLERLIGDYDALYR